MAKNQNSSKRSTYEKIRKATFGRFRRVEPSKSSKAPVSYTQPVSKEIPIEHVPPLDAKSVKNVRFSSNDDNFSGGKSLVDQKTFGEAKFDSFIDRMKMKMSAPSDVGVVKTVSRRHDTFNERVSNFIDQTKLKFRATSSMGAKKYGSFK
ncbi:hypothetical protein HanRHA438_Chr01g0003621 [Helianthus annuus]|nr:hypothetical protein HanRHA438_Chr01g0003621 [Helianthus annuus]